MGRTKAKTRLSELLHRVVGGEEIVIRRLGRPVARLVPIGAEQSRSLRQDRGLFEVPDDFDDPLSGDLLDALGA